MTATVRANARALPEAASYPDANLRALAAQFEAALQAYYAVFHRGRTEAEADAVNDAVKAIAQKIIAVPGTDISIMRLKARVYLWDESTDVEKLAAEDGDCQSEAALASLFRDLGADRPIGSAAGAVLEPIFDFIEAHRKAWARIVDAHENLKGALSEEAFTFEIKARDSKVADAKNELLKTPPATLAGARAIIEYLIEWDKDCDPETSYEYLSTLLRSPIFAQEEARS
jgi:hypothetical protein